MLFRPIPSHQILVAYAPSLDHIKYTSFDQSRPTPFPVAPALLDSILTFTAVYLHQPELLAPSTCISLIHIPPPPLRYSHLSLFLSVRCHESEHTPPQTFTGLPACV